MSNSHNLTKTLTDKITCDEEEKYFILKQNAELAWDNFVQAQHIHVNAARKADKKYGVGCGDPLYVRKLADKGFELEYKAFKASDARNSYRKFLERKYL